MEPVDINYAQKISIMGLNVESDGEDNSISFAIEVCIF